MNQLTLDLFANPTKTENTQSIENLKSGLEEYIKISGLIAYKDFYMKLKNGVILIPAGVSKEDYLTMAREVYESRAAKVNRQKSRSTFFAIRNKNKAN
jgi:hypothetical protein